MKSYSVPDGKGGGSMSKGTTCLLAFLIILGTVLLVGAAVMYGKIFPELYRKKVNDALILRNGSEAAERFIKSPVPTYLKFHVFNVTNPREVIESGANPFLQELGPYVFREDKEKKIISWNEEKATVRFQIFRTYHFQPQMSSGKLSDSVNHVNALGLGLVKVFTSQKALTSLLGISLDELIGGIRGELVESHTVGELLFDGFKMDKYFPEDVSHLCRLRDNCMFGFYYGKNNTYDKEYEVSTGENDIASVGRILLYDNEEKLPYHYEDRCNAINGTDGVQVAPGLSQKESFYVFASDLCRSFEFVYKKEVEVEGISALRYIIPQSVFIDPNKRRENMCFCQKDSDTGTCIYKGGVLQLSSCKNGSPVIASQPHFYMGESEYLEDVKGLSPCEEKHEVYLDVEPVTGAVIRGSKKVQINIIVKPDSRLKFLKFVKKLFYFPVFWVDETACIDSTKAEDFRSRVITPYQAGKWSLVAAIVLGGVLVFFVALTCTVKRRTRLEKE